MFSGLLGAIAPTFAGRALESLKPALSSVVEFFTGEGIDRAARGLESLGLSKISKGLNKIGKAARIMSGKEDGLSMLKKRGYASKLQGEMDDTNMNKDMPDDNDAAEFQNYLSNKKMKGNRFDMNEPPDFLK